LLLEVSGKRCVCNHISVYLHIYIFTHLRIYFTSIYLHIYICLCNTLNQRTNLFLDVCEKKCIFNRASSYVCIYISIYIHTMNWIIARTCLSKSVKTGMYAPIHLHIYYIIILISIYLHLYTSKYIYTIQWLRVRSCLSKSVEKGVYVITHLYTYMSTCEQMYYISKYLHIYIYIQYTESEYELAPRSQCRQIRMESCIFIIIIYFYISTYPYIFISSLYLHIYISRYKYSIH